MTGDRHDDAVAAVQAAMRGRSWIDVDTPRGTVRVVAVGDRQDEGGQRYLEIMVDQPAGGDPHFRIFNPPLLVPDPAGETSMGPRRYRRDPLAAVAMVIASHGGTRRGGGSPR